MRHLLQHFTFVIFILFSTLTVGQNQEIDWGPELEGKGLIDIIGEGGDHIYATQKGLKLIKPFINLLKIDKTSLQVIQTQRLGLSAIKTIYLDFSINDEKVQILALEGKKLRRVIYDLNFREQSNEIIDQLDKYPLRRELMYEGSIKLFPTDMISSFRSTDKSKVTVLLSKDGKKRGGTDLYTFDINDGLKQLSKTAVTTSANTKEVLESVELRSDGTVNLLIKVYIDGKNESKEKEPNYVYKIHTVGIDSIQSDMTLPRVSGFWKNATLKSTSDNSIIVAAMTQLKPQGRPFGYQIIKLSSENEVIFNKSHEIATTENKNKLPKTMFLRNLIINNDLDFVLFAEDSWGKTYVSTAAGKIPNDKFYSNNIFIDGFDNEGNEKWSECIYRDVIEQSRRKLLSDALIHYNSDAISMYYNTTEKNTKKLNSSKPRGEKLPSKSCVTLKANITKAGDLSFNKISSKNKMHILSTTSLPVQGETYFVGAKNNKMKKMHIGVIQN